MEEGVDEGMGSRSDVEFEGFDGTLLRGWWCAPKGVAPAVAMAHGFSAVKEMALDRYAGVFREAGLGVLVYDHRNFGASDGEPRQEIDPWAQVRDYRSAIGWLAARPDVDAGRIGISTATPAPATPPSASGFWARPGSKIARRTR
jgi:fermentation-respiration switch protein FrsA (DUF1100 family)